MYIAEYLLGTCAAHNIRVMNWGEVELEPEVDDWFDTLDQDQRGAYGG
jgi:hypothetical protein